MNNFYYGKSGKGDFKKEDLPKNRFQLFFEMLRIRFSALCRLNLMTVLIFIPLIYFISVSVSTFLQGVMMQAEFQQIIDQASISADGVSAEEYTSLVDSALAAAEKTPEEIQFYHTFSLRDFLNTILFQLTLYCIPCIAITGPVECGLAYVTRNWARDEHAFIWSDFKDAVKENWKQGLAVSCITSVLPFILYTCWNFYGSMAANQGAFFILPQMLVLILCLVWILGLIYMYPLIVTYKVRFRDLIKNGIMLGIGRLPQNVGVRLLALIPAVIVCLLLFTTSIGMYALMVLLLYYIIIGIALSRFVNASLTNAVFDRYINSHMQGVQINRGLSVEDEDDEDESDTEDQSGPSANSES